jgi:hypothetical protein
MRKFSIEKEFVLNFITHNDSEDWLIEPKENAFLFIEGGSIFYTNNDVVKESNNSLGTINSLLKEGCIAELGLDHPKTLYLSPADFKALTDELEKPPKEPNEALKKAAENYKKLTTPTKDII